VEFSDSGRELRTQSGFSILFTLQGSGQRHGLGLSICYGIVKDMEENPGRNREEGGATIEVRCCERQAGHVETTPPKRRESLLAGRVLLVEDEARCWIWNAMFWRRGSRGYDFHERSGHAATAPRGRV